jgi:hypothetical protein
VNNNEGRTMTNNNTVERLILTSPQACIVSIPHLLGFTPKESLVTIWLKDSMVVVTQRIDIDAVSHRAAFRQGEALILEHGFTAAILVAFTDGDWTEELGNLANGLSDFLEIRDMLLVRGGRYFSLLCNDPACCPPEGKPIPDMPEVTAEFVGAGSAPLADRSEIEGYGKPAGTIPMPAAPTDEVEKWRDAAILGIVAVKPTASSEALVALGACLHDLQVRDTIMWLAAQDDANLNAWGEKVEAIARSMMPADAAPACAVTAALAYLRGDGARANIALDHALTSDDNYTLAQMLKFSLSEGIPPQRFLTSILTLTYETVRFREVSP